nr:DUF2461 domain-containing protein [Brucepastera parasyntrophica]
METKSILEFLTELSENNSIDWMHANKAGYEAAKNEFKSLLLTLINKICEFDDSVRELDPGTLIFRLNRDTRFSHDKSPYNPSFRAHISKAGKMPIPAGYYLNITPGNIF